MKSSRIVKHLLLAGLVLPVSLAGYHVMAESGLKEPVTEALPFGLGDFSIGAEYSLPRLALLERDLYRVESRYVEKGRLDPQAMFDGALDAVQREFAEVLFRQPSASQNLHVSVGGHSKVLRVESVRNFDSLYRELSRVAQVLDAHASPETERREIEYAMVNGMLSTLDPHTVLLPPAAARDMEVDNQGEFGGLGIEISMVEGELTVKVPIEDTPAYRAGLKPDDRIVRIEGESTINIDLDEAVSKLRGMVGDPVTILVMRKGWSAPRSFTIVREKIRINALEGELLSGDVGYIRIKSFNARAAEDLRENLNRFHRTAQGQLRGLVLDLRMNPGGFLNQAIDVADMFLAEGVIVATEEGASGERAEQRARRSGTEPEYPIAVLVNASSASASEIVAGAIRNQGRGVVLGERTFGKGSIQHLYPHQDDESRLKLTVGRYLTPGDKSIQSVGVTPDIRLVPSLVEAAQTLDEPDPWGLEPLPQVSLYWREWLDREDSLDRSFERAERQLEQPIYQVRYHYAVDEEREGVGIDPADDWEVQFARDVVMAAPGPRRAETLRGAARVINRRRVEQSRALAGAFDAVGIDWSEGSVGANAQLALELDLGDDGVLIAGEHELIGLTVTNTGTEPLYRVSAVTESENPWLNQAEFYFGKVPPGESRTYRQRVALHSGYPSSSANVTVKVQDADRELLTQKVIRVETRGKQLPLLNYSVEMFDGIDGKGTGNGDGVPAVGETILMEVSVTNQGAGPSADAFVRLKNRSGRALDLTEGGFSAGRWQDRHGEPCEELSAGCKAVMEPGAVHTGVLQFELVDVPSAGGWDLDLLVGDNRAYDYSVIQQGGFYDFFQLEESLFLSAVDPFESIRRTSPVINITKTPDAITTEGLAVISGNAKSVGGTKDVIVYHGEDKIYYDGGGDVEVRPFTVERQLAPGPHSFYILVRGENGLTASKSVHVWAEGSG
ncbi:MAG: MXAN_5808 family serine peptidase [Myxococcota bacterium]|nr:MXAN_5808 family serine peptidase [Myxococcota bacterium]